MKLTSKQTNEQTLNNNNINTMVTKPCISTKVGAVSCAHMQDKYGLNRSSQCTVNIVPVLLLYYCCGYISAISNFSTHYIDISYNL